MRLARPGRQRRAIGLTSLIDVVFLLLVFFMLSSTFLKFGTVTVDTAGAARGDVVVDPSKLVLVRVGADRALQINGVATPMNGLAPSSTIGLRREPVMPW
ncbi:MAG: biopolymer transporter ExbD [Pseudomonadota bacterium]